MTVEYTALTVVKNPPFVSRALMVNITSESTTNTTARRPPLPELSLCSPEEERPPPFRVGTWLTR